MIYVDEKKIMIITFVILVGISLFALGDIILDINEGVPFRST